MGPSWPAASAVADPSRASNGVARVRLRARDGTTWTARHGTARLAARLQSIGSARMNPSHYVPHPTNDKERRAVNQQVCLSQRTNGSPPPLPARACSGDVSQHSADAHSRSRAQAVRVCLFARLASPRLASAMCGRPGLAPVATGRASRRSCLRSREWSPSWRRTTSARPTLRAARRRRCSAVETRASRRCVRLRAAATGARGLRSARRRRRGW